MAPTLKVTYFGIPGKAEAVRLLAALAGLDIEDKKIDFAQHAPVTRTQLHNTWDVS